MIKLNYISELVHFDEDAHKYTLMSNNKTLTGVTTLLRHMGLSADYSGVSEEVLAKAAERGKSIHKNCELVDLFDKEEDCREANAYYRMRNDLGLKPVYSEYLISDLKDIASSIDLVLTSSELEKENKVVLADIKTTSSIHYEPLAWQLSIYKYLFELQNPDLKVAELYGVWLPKEQYGSPKMFKVDMKPWEEVERLIDCFVTNLPFTQEIALSESNPALIAVQNQLIQVMKVINEAKETEETLKANLLKMMQDADVKKFESDKIILTRVLGGVQQRFDSATFKKDHPDMYSDYTKETRTSDSLRIKLK